MALRKRVIGWAVVGRNIEFILPLLGFGLQILGTIATAAAIDVYALFS